MNCETGELMRIDQGCLTRDAADRLLSDGFVPVPKHLEEDALNELAGKNSVMVDMKSKTPLTTWANKMNQGRNEKCLCGSGKKYKHCCGK